MKQILALLVISTFAACSQSQQVFAPVNNVASGSSTTAATYTLTVNVAATNANHQNQPFSVLLYKDGAVVAAQFNNGATAGTDRTDGTGAATLVLNGVDTNGCPTTTPAALVAGSYTLYFAIQYNAETATTVNPMNGSCGGNGWIKSSSGGNLYGATASISVSANTTFTVNGTNLALFRQHTFDLNAGAGNYACLVTDIGATQYAATLQPLAVYGRSNNGTTTGNTDATTYLLPVGTYKYFCSLGANTTHFETGVDTGANGNLTVTGASTTTLASGNFSAL